jgi:hypothetical protein
MNIEIKRGLDIFFGLKKKVLHSDEVGWATELIDH